MENPEFNVRFFNCQHVVTQIRYRQQISVEVFISNQHIYKLQFMLAG